jgi:ABC-type uncharacterized transport system fused permease/ATPase subunit
MTHFTMPVLSLQVVDSNLRIIYTRRNIEMFTVPYDYLVYVIPYVVLAPMYFSGAIDLGSVTQVSTTYSCCQNSPPKVRLLIFLKYI